MQITDTLCPWGQSFLKVQSCPLGPGNPCLQFRLQAVTPLPMSDLSTSRHFGLPKTEDTKGFLGTATAFVVDISESSRAPGWEDDVSFKYILLILKPVKLTYIILICILNMPSSCNQNESFMLHAFSL